MGGRNDVCGSIFRPLRVYSAGMFTDAQSQPSAEKLQQLLEFETLISALSSRFVNLRPSEVDRAIEDGLHRVCEHLGIDLAVLWQWSTRTPEVIAPTHSYPPVKEVLPPGRCIRSSSPGSDGRTSTAAWSPCRRWRSSRRKPTSTASPAATTASSRI